MVLLGERQTRHGRAICLGLLLFLGLGEAPGTAQMTGLKTVATTFAHATGSSFVISAVVQDSCSISGNVSSGSQIRCVENTPMEAVYAGQDDRMFATRDADQDGGVSPRRIVFCDIPARTAESAVPVFIAGGPETYSTVEACF